MNPPPGAWTVFVTVRDKQGHGTGPPRLALVVIASEAKQSRCRRLGDHEIAAAPAGASQ